MKSYAWLFLAIAAVVIGGGAPRQDNNRRGQPAAAAAQQEQAVLERKGYLIPVRTVVVTPEVSGRITTLHCDDGTDVKKGDVLGQIDAPVYRLELKRAEALVERAAARYEECVRRKEGVETGRAELLVAEAERDRAKHLFEQTKVRAPFDGTIIAKKAEEGGIIDRSHFAGYTALCELADLTKLEVDVWVEERDIRLVSVGQKCEVRTEAFPEVVYQAAVTRMLPVADRAKGAVGVRVGLNLSKRHVNLRPEMGVVVRFMRSTN
jgi:RND family efflux transporter MFP subunit